MSYQVLARKYRPHSFRELVGQEHVARALINALDQDRLHHAYLFTGTRGVGKTTIARILAKCLNCETGVSSEPCGVCGACREIDEGRYIDLIEVDAASRTKVEDTRELLDNVQYAPSRGRYKVYLIDEVHMLSGHSFNALLKTLEEPPPHVKFLLATTDPQKLPITVLSRCLQFGLKAMSPERIVGHLLQVLQKEVVACEESALWEIGRAANGSMRDALSLTDQAIAFGNGKLNTADVRAMLGSIDRDLVFRVLEAVHSGDASAVLAVCAALAEQSVDFAGALTELVSTLHRVALGQMLPEAVDNSLGDSDRVLALAQALSAEDTQLYYQIALHGRRDLPYAADPRSGFEMTLLRMLAFRPLPTASEVGRAGGAARTSAPARPQVLRGTSAGHQAHQVQQVPRVTAPATAVAAQTHHASAPAQVYDAQALQATAPSQQPVAVNPLPNTVPASAAQPVSNVVMLHAPVFSPVNSPVPEATKPAYEIQMTAQTDINRVREVQPTPGSPASAYCSAETWEHWVHTSGLTGGGLNLARHAALVAISDAAVELQLAPRHEILASVQSLSQIEACFQRCFPGVQIKLAKKDPAYTVPLQVIAARKQARIVVAEASLRNDPVVQTLINDFQAEIQPDSIIPVE